MDWQKKLTRSTKDCLCWGVCSGLARWLEIDPTVVRIGYAMLTLVTGAFPGILLYLAMGFIIPPDNRT